MNEAIWRYPINVAGEQTVKMPQGAQLLSVQIRDGMLTVWAKVYPGNPTVEKKIFVYGTGHPLPHDPGNYVGTVQAGPLVWHVFEERRITANSAIKPHRLPLVGDVE